jgi:hypothetical protein
MLFNIRVLQIWVMETIIIYDFLHLLNLIKIRYNMNFGENWHLQIYVTRHIHFFSFKESGEKLVLIDQTNR